jgi:hypothetical protein
MVLLDAVYLYKYDTRAQNMLAINTHQLSSLCVLPMYARLFFLHRREYMNKKIRCGTWFNNK